MWYDEIKEYDWNKLNVGAATGQGTQLIWADTEKVGFGHATDGKQVFVCARYDPHGN